jgi:hypothetical protein
MYSQKNYAKGFRVFGEENRIDFDGRQLGFLNKLQ